MHIQKLSTRFRTLGFPDGSGGKESACNTGDLGLIPGLGRSYAWRIPWTGEPGKLQSMGHKESDTTECLSLFIEKTF